MVTLIDTGFFLSGILNRKKAGNPYIKQSLRCLYFHVLSHGLRISSRLIQREGNLLRIISRKDKLY